MKSFLIWLVVQCVFARVLFGISIQMWSGLKIDQSYVPYFIIPVMLICIAETVVSGIVVYPLVIRQS